MRTLIVSDLHLGARNRMDVLGGRVVREALLARLEGVERLVLLGDTLELRQGPTREALASAQPVLTELARHLDGAEVVIVPGNHDHALIARWLEARGSRRAPAALSLEQRIAPGDASPAAAAIAGWMGRADVSLAYPGVWLRKDVYAIHGHYLDCHSTLPTFERLAAGVMARLLGPLPDGRLVPDDYERLLEPMYAWIHAVAQRAELHGRVTHGGSSRVWRTLAGDGHRPVRARVLAGLVPVGVGALNRAGLGPLSPDLSVSRVRASGTEAMAEVVKRMGIQARHVVFGHTHRAGPLEGEASGPWRVAGEVSLHNCGCWVHERGLLAREPQSPFWPGGAIALADSGPPVLQRLLADRPLLPAAPS